MKKPASSISPVVPGKYLVFIERLVQEHYQTLEVDADSEAQARERALARFFDGAVAYISSTQIEPATARVRPMREKHLRRPAQPQGDTAAGLRTSSRFLVEDEALVQPSSMLPGTRPAAVTAAQARALCRHFDASGHSNHSGQGTTLWVVLEHCAEAGIAYHLRALPGLGYYVERAKAADDGLALRMSVETHYGPPSE